MLAPRKSRRVLSLESKSLGTNGVILEFDVIATVHSATKAAVRSFARTWTTDLKPRKIRVNVISPGVVPTEGYRSLGDERQIEQFAAQMATQIPIGRVGEPDEIAKAVVFLASDDRALSPALS